MQDQSQISVFNYDIFISYKSEEESWARRLAETLRGFGLKVWRDHDSGFGIRIGENWSQEVHNGIRSSKIMIVLWSKLIAQNASTVVLREINDMEELSRNDNTGQRRFVTVSLDGESIVNFHPLSASQADFSFKNLYQKVGAGGAENISAIEWYSAIRNLVEALGIEDIMEVRFVVGAMNATQAQEINDDPERWAIDPIAFKLMLRMMEKTSPYDVQRYGASPNDWKPFPQLEQPWSIRDLIDFYDGDKRVWSQGHNEYAKWILVSYSDEMAADNQQSRDDARDAIQGSPCLVVIDPVSLMHKTVYDNMITNGGLQNHPGAFVIGIAPYVSQMHNDLYNATIELENQLSQRLAAAYSRFRKHFEPADQPCVMNVEHEFQFMRWLQVAADNIVKARKTPMRSRGRAQPNSNMVRRMRRSVSQQPTSEIVIMSGTGGNTP